MTGFKSKREAAMTYGWSIHVIPEDDDQDHVATLNCWCDPEVNEDGTIVHSSHDGREAYETGKRKTS